MESSTHRKLTYRKITQSNCVSAQLWKNCINLWFDLKEYQRLFYAEVFQPFKLRRQAQFIFAKYIVDKSPEDVEIGVENKKIIYQELEPPFEELFDDVEVYVLILLLVPWMHMIEMDMSKFRKVEVIKETRRLDSMYYEKLEELQKNLFPNEQFILPARSISLVHPSDNVKGSNYWQTVPEEFSNYTLDALIRNRLELENFQVQMHDVVEDQMLQKSKKKQVQWNKWLASSKEIIAFRKTLLNPITAFQFQQFVSLKGELMQNNVIFWLEVQKYKEMFHSQASEETIQNKISSIINCFINSSIPPPIQIDISPECARRIINYNQGQGPYIFREAQVCEEKYVTELHKMA
ncbi:hypothetical protein chiPu_0000070 [Chiloscyllium punctatum]|uniref:RGS domain-containing protein n=1 Tax=Chiloscyllium punctatum TaxID=137246 RepID=A0A401RN99_CHIPU|nr:hypothetical protein [Chiloscyllium punctatum]